MLALLLVLSGCFKKLCYLLVIMLPMYCPFIHKAINFSKISYCFQKTSSFRYTPMNCVSVEGSYKYALKETNSPMYNAKVWLYECSCK